MGNNIYGLCGDGSNDRTTGDFEWKSDADKAQANKSAEVIQNKYRNSKVKGRITNRRKEVEDEFDLNIENFGKFISDEEMSGRTDRKVREVEERLEALILSKEDKEKYANVFQKPAILFNDGSVYKGSWNYTNKKHGFGKYIKPDGSKYEGFWSEGKISGKGRYIEKIGNYYEGK